MPNMLGKLYVVATPIGNLEDISLRAIKTLLSVPIIACEDTRHTGQLIKILKERYNSPRGELRFISVRDWNEAQIVDRILLELQTQDVALVSDAGTPLISDPGFKLVRAARQAGVTVVPIPGPCAAIAALSAAGLPTDKFFFWGFLPKKWELFPNITNIIYESPIRLAKTIEQFKNKYPQADIVIASELTKLHEAIYELKIVNCKLPSRGEAVILVNFAPSSPEDLESAIAPTR